MKSPAITRARPTLHLDIPSTCKEDEKARHKRLIGQILTLNQAQLIDNMHNLRPFKFMRTHQALRYDDVLNVRFGRDSSYHHLTNEGGFIFIRPVDNSCFQGKYFTDDKIHLSVEPKQVRAAFDVLTSLLFSADSPIEEWKITDMKYMREKNESNQRVTEGAQWTLYIKMDSTCTLDETALELVRVRDFIQEIEKTLIEQGFSPGIRPISDVFPKHWKYASYRNESYDRLTSGWVQHLDNEPCYRLLTTQRSQ